MVTSNSIIAGETSLLQQVNRSIRLRLFDSRVEDVLSAYYQYKLGSLHADDLVALLSATLEEMRRLRGDSPLQDACDLAARAIVEGLLAQCDEPTAAAVAGAVEAMMQRVRQDVTLESRTPQSDSGTGFANTNSNTNSKELKRQPEIRNHEFEEETRE